MRLIRSNTIISMAVVAGLLLLFVLIWSRLPASGAQSDPAALLGLVIAAFLARPDRLRACLLVPKTVPSVAAVALLCAGSLTGLVFLQALGWSFLALLLCRSCFEFGPSRRLWRLIPILVCVFPWISSDFPGLSWLFRVSAAAFAVKVFSFLGFDVVREEMGFCVQGLMVHVTPDCSGMNSLQSMMIFGATMAYRLLPESGRYWLVLALLPLVAWLANAMRVVAVTVLAMVTDVEFASGQAHAIVGLVVLLGIFTAFTFSAFNLFRWTRAECADPR